MTDLTLEQVAQERTIRIDQMLADIDQKLADRDRKRQEIKFAPWQLVLAGVGTGAALMAAGTALGVFLTRMIG